MAFFFRRLKIALTRNETSIAEISERVAEHPRYGAGEETCSHENPQAVSATHLGVVC